jgi:hypothetical protein
LESEGAKRGEEGSASEPQLDQRQVICDAITTGKERMWRRTNAGDEGARKGASKYLLEEKGKVTKHFLAHPQTESRGGGGGGRGRGWRGVA